jgi:hypothetical protein
MNENDIIVVVFIDVAIIIKPHVHCSDKKKDIGTGHVLFLFKSVSHILVKNRFIQKDVEEVFVELSCIKTVQFSEV